MPSKTNIDTDVAGLLGITERLSDAQRVALANSLILTITDADCALSLGRLAQNAALVRQELARAAFIARDARRRVVS